MDNTFHDDEKLYRAIRPWNRFIRKDGTITPEAFIDRKGLSVDRGNGRTNEEATAHLKESGKEGKVGYVSVRNCRDTDAVPKYLPTSNVYHSEIHKSETEKVLDYFQAESLAGCVVICGDLDE